MIAAVVLTAGAVGAGCDQYFYNTQPLTNAVVVGIINETPYRAILTAGAWEPLDQTSLPDFGNVRIESKDNDPTGQGGVWLTTQVLSSGTATPGCRRSISIGSSELIQQINNEKSILANVTPAFTITDQAAMVTGVNFSDAPKDSPDAANPTVGTAEPITVNDGIDFPCGSIVVFTLVQDATAPSGFRIDFGVIY